MKNNRIVISGGNGFIGGHLVDRLISEGYEVHVIDNQSSGHYCNHQATYHLIDIGDCHIDDLIQVIEGASCVFHLAAKARVQPSFDDPIGYHRTNVTGTMNLLEACRLAGVKNFVFSSSSSVYGNCCDTEALQEWDELNPDSPYAMQKKIGEDYCNYYSVKFGLNCKILRYFNVYGDRMIPGGQYAQAIRIFLSNYEKGEPFRIFGDGEQRRDFTHVSDVVDANLKAMKSTHAFTFNIGTGINYSVNEVCNMIDRERERTWLEAKPEPKFTLADNHFAGRYLNWKPTVKLPEWIQQKINVIDLRAHY